MASGRYVNPPRAGSIPSGGVGVAGSGNKITVSLVGDKELMRQLEQLGNKVYRRVLKSASLKAFKPVIKSARAKVPRESGLLRKSLGSKQKSYPRNGVIVTIVGPRTGFAQEVIVQTPKGPMKVKRDPVKYAHLVEFGTEAHSTTAGAKDKLRMDKKGNISAKNIAGRRIAFQSGEDHPGARPKPFMRPAFDSNKSLVLTILRSELGKGIEREAAKSGGAA